jgi:hypothetical protein
MTHPEIERKILEHNQVSYFRITRHSEGYSRILFEKTGEAVQKMVRTRINKKIKFSSYIRKFRMEQLESHK